MTSMEITVKQIRESTGIPKATVAYQLRYTKPVRRISQNAGVYEIKDLPLEIREKVEAALANGFKLDEIPESTEKQKKPLPRNKEFAGVPKCEICETEENVLEVDAPEGPRLLCQGCYDKVYPDTACTLPPLTLELYAVMRKVFSESEVRDILVNAYGLNPKAKVGE